MGDYNVKLGSERADELGSLTREFALMVEGVKERERLAALLSDHAVESLVQDSETRTDNDARTFTGIALVSDIRNFTTLCENRPTSEITDMLNHHFAVMSEIISENGGRIYKFIGDAIEAVFEEDDVQTTAENAIKTAVKMNAALAEINANRQKQGLFTYAFGIGLARGIFYAGSVGSEDTRLDYSIISEAFHKAALLEAATKKLSAVPLAFDREIASLLKNSDSCQTSAGEEIELYTINAASPLCTDTSRNFLKTHTDSSNDINETCSTGAATRPPGSLDYRGLSLLLFAVLAVLCAVGVYYGFSIDNQMMTRFSRSRASENIFRLIRQIKTEDAEKVAFELKMEALLEATESRLRFKLGPNDARIISANIDKVSAELEHIGLAPRRVFATTDFVNTASSPPDVAFSSGLNQYQKDFYHRLAYFLLLYFNDFEREVVERSVDRQMNEFFSTDFDANHLAAEKIAGSMPIEGASGTELFYWNYYRVFSDEMLSQPPPSDNSEMLGTDEEKMRIAGILMFSIDQKQASGNPRLLVEAYSDSDCEIALVSSSGEKFHRSSFPVDVLNSSASYTGRVTSNYLIETDEIIKGGKQFKLSAVARIDAGSLHLCLPWRSYFLSYISIGLYMGPPPLPDLFRANWFFRFCSRRSCQCLPWPSSPAISYSKTTRPPFSSNDSR